MQRKKVAIVCSFFRHGQWRGIMRYGQQVGWICQRHDHDTLERLENWRPDGVVFQVDEYDEPLLAYIRSCEVARVGLRAALGIENETPLVLPDLAGFGRIVARHFIASNYRRLCFLGPRSDDTANPGSTHYQGMLEVADAHDVQLEAVFPDQRGAWRMLGLTPRRKLTTGWERFWEMGPAMIDHLLGRGEPVGLFSAFVEPAMEFIEMIDERAVEVPGRIGMVAQTEDALAGLVTKVPLSCLVPDYERQGFEAARLLDRVMGGERVARNHREYVDACEFIVRRSSNQIVTSDPLVSRLLEEIRQRAHSLAFSPDSLAEAAGCSLRSVQMRFRRALGRGVADVIRHYRTQRAAELIRNTDMPLQDIVAECGFSGHHQLERSVRRVFAMNPSAFRREFGRAGKVPNPNGSDESK